MNILGASRKLLNKTDKSFCDSFSKYLQKHVVDVTGHHWCPVTSTTPFLSYTSISVIPYIAKICMVTMCYGANLMEQNFEQKNTTFPKFMMNVVGVTVSNQMSQCCGCNGVHKISATFINNCGSQYTLIAVVVALN